jgi:S1-C subfamily serine protease
MRGCVLGLVGVLALGTTLRAEDEPQGRIGIKIVMLENNKDGKVGIEEVFSDSPAEKAGLKKDDVIIKVGDFKADDVNETVKEIIKNKPGTKLKILIKREGKEKTIEVEVGKPNP